MKKDDIEQLIKNSKSRSELCRNLGYHTNGVGLSKTDDILIEYGYSKDYYKKKNRKYCLECGKEILKNDNKFCDSSCSAKYNNKRRILKENRIKDVICIKCGTDTIIKKGTSELNYYCEKCKKDICKQRHKTYNTSVFILDVDKYKDCELLNKKCEYCDKDFVMLSTYKDKRRKTCSDECSIKLRNINLSKRMKERIENGTHKGWSSRNIESYPETFFKEVLKNNGLEDKYSFNHPINKRKDLNIDESYNYFLDFYFTDKKLVLEIDGNQHKYRKEHDDLRDERLLDVGIKTYRIKWKSINSEKGKEYIKKEIEKFLDYYNKN